MAGSAVKTVTIAFIVLTGARELVLYVFWSTRKVLKTIHRRTLVEFSLNRDTIGFIVLIGALEMLVYVFLVRENRIK